MRSLAAAALAAAVLVPAAAAAHGHGPALTLVHRPPQLVVRGSGFRADERVRVVAPGRAVVVRSSPGGAFVARLDGVRVGRCEALVVRALGFGGSTAALHLPQPQCAPASSP